MIRYNKLYLLLLLVMFTAFNTCSCTKENMEGCEEVAVKITYSHNILSANAIENQAQEVVLYVFDKDGIFVQQYSNGSEPITNDFRIRLQDLKSGNYRFVAWAQSTHLSDDQSYFSIPTLTSGVSSIDELVYSIKRESGTQRHELNNFLVGTTEATIDYSQAKQLIVLDLKKVTNKVRIVILPYVQGSTLDVENYEFSIVDTVGSGHINYDYTLLPDKKITYRPYYAANLVPENTETLSPGETDKAAVVEINTSRLMEANAPRLHIVEKNGGREIVSMNLPWVFSLINTENHDEWSLQEYLDRQDRYVITLFFSDSTWMSGTIIINGWVINENKVDL